ncbi:MAG: HD-GYP domain-containing protein [Firmicutes bacterium]|nr:HD-GYP domain-containing protein [Bacillota bacterium]
MKIVRVENLEPGMQLAKAVYSAEGTILLNAGVILKNRYISRLRALGYPAVYIGDAAEVAALPEAVSEATRQRAITIVKSSFDSVKLGGTLVIEPIARVVNSIVDEVVLARDVVVPLTDIRRHDDYTFGHCVNVCVLSVMMGIALELDDLTLRELAMGAILHDVGKIRIPDQILLKPTRLTPAEWDEMKQHTRYGFDVLRECPGLSTRAAHVAYQHHERVNGCGYPRGLADSGIHLFARIVAVADTYDAMTSDRIYRKGVSPFEALQEIKRLRSRYLDDGVVGVFLSSVVPYPPGCKVKLDTGEVGMVLKARGYNSLVVQVEYDALGRPLGKQTEIDINQHEGKRIARMV